jgi:hypothetical protein
VTRFNRALTDGGVVERLWDPTTRHGAALPNRVIGRQAQIIVYMNDDQMMVFTFLPALLLLLLMRAAGKYGPVGRSGGPIRTLFSMLPVVDAMGRLLSPFSARLAPTGGG